MKVALPRIEKVLLHDINPGQDPGHLSETLMNSRLPRGNIGIEVDVANKRLLAGKFEPCCVSRDRSRFVPIAKHLKAFIDVGFHGPNLVDLTCRRSAEKVMVQIHQDDNDILSRVIVQVPEVVVAFKTPAREGVFHIEEHWKSGWPRLVISSRFPNLIKEFLSEGIKPIIFFEPTSSDKDRKDLAGTLKSVDTIIYKLPFLTYNALFDKDRCFKEDCAYFSQILERTNVNLIPMGSVESFQNTHIL